MSDSPQPGQAPELVYWHQGQTCQNDDWERAYTRFETPEQEVGKFLKRLRRLGVDAWPKGLRVVELFCGRGNGLLAERQLGFTNLEGVDLSPALLAMYRGPGRLYVGDCRDLHFADASKDVIIVQGGLHHLPSLDDLEKTLSEVHRVFGADGRLVLVEPWLTPFLRVFHACFALGPLRRVWPTFDAAARMTELEAATYFAWLANAGRIEEMLARRFSTLQRRVGWGKFMYIGQRITGY